MRWILWGALLFAVFIYYFVVNTIAKADVPDAADADPGLARLFLVIGLALAVVAVGIKYFMRGRLRGAGQSQPSIRGEQAYIAALAIGEAPAILGLVLGLQGATKEEYLPLFVISLAIFAMLSPVFFFPATEKE